jgi:hypothetical protein
VATSTFQAFRTQVLNEVAPTFAAFQTQFESLNAANAAMLATLKTMQETTSALRTTPAAADLYRAQGLAYQEQHNRTAHLPLHCSSNRPALQAASSQESQLRTIDGFLEKCCDTATSMSPELALPFMVENIAYARSKITEAADQSKFQAQVIVKADSLGQGFTDYAHSDLALQHGGNHAQATSALAEAAKAYMNDTRDRDYKPRDAHYDGRDNGPKHDNKRTRRKPFTPSAVRDLARAKHAHSHPADVLMAQPCTLLHDLRPAFMAFNLH